MCEACGNPRLRKTSGLAITSLVLGIASFIFIIFTAAPAIICGHISLSLIKRSRGTLEGRGMAIAGTILGYAFAILFILHASFVRGGREMVERVTCANNLQQIAKGCMLYAIDNENKYPDKLSRLYPKYIDSTEIFHCRGDKFRDLSIPHAHDLNTNYIYVAGLKSTDDPKTILAYDKPDNHKHKKRNVLHIDGSVNWEESNAISPPK